MKYYLEIQRNDTVFRAPISQTLFESLAEGELSEETFVQVSAQAYKGDEMVTEVRIVGGYV
jgi:hypothetical protein